MKKIAWLLFIMLIVTVASGTYYDKYRKTLGQYGYLENILKEDSSNRSATNARLSGQQPNTPGAGIPTQQPAPANQTSPTNPAQPNSGLNPANLSHVMKVASLRDRLKVLQIVGGRLSTNDILVLKQAAQGELTPEARRKAKEMVLQRFSQEEIQELKALYKKYQ